MKLSEPLARALDPLFAALPLDRAMEQLVVGRGASAEMIQVVEDVLSDGALSVAPLQSAIWLYVDALDRSHTISQGIENETGSFWHGIMHRREGDFSNSHYWFNKVGHHPAMDLIPGYDPHAFIDQAEQQRDNPSDPLIQLQRQEWGTLFEWCAAQ